MNVKFTPLKHGLTLEHLTIKIMKRKIIYAVLIIGIAGAIYGYYEYNRKPATAAELKVDFTISAEEMYKEFENEDAATKKFLNKVVEINGTVTAISKNKDHYDVSLETGDPMAAITIQLIPDQNATAEKTKEGDVIKVRGICNGKLADIELNKGVIIK